MPFRQGEMLDYKAKDMPKAKLVMVKEVIAEDGDLGGVYRCFAISPDLNLIPDVNDFIPGNHLTRFM